MTERLNMIKNKDLKCRIHSTDLSICNSWQCQTLTNLKPSPYLLTKALGLINAPKYKVVGLLETDDEIKGLEVIKKGTVFYAFTLGLSTAKSIGELKETLKDLVYVSPILSNKMHIVKKSYINKHPEIFEEI